MLLAHQLVDLQQYPITSLDTPRSVARLDQWKQQFQDQGVCVLERFVGAPALTEMVREATELAASAFHTSVTGNAYLETLSEEFPVDHPKRLTETTSLGVVAYDQFPDNSSIKKLYQWDAVTNLVRHIVGVDRLYLFGCPLGALNLSVMRHGDYLRWHFDSCDFVVSIPLQEAESGGVFEFSKNIRTPDNENFARVGRLLRGDRTSVRALTAAAGSLILFKGRNTIHRVTRVVGQRARLYILLGYAEAPNAVSSPYLMETRYGRTA